MSLSSEEIRTILALYDVPVVEGIVRPTCRTCGRAFNMQLSAMDEKLHKYGDACLRYCYFCAPEGHDQ